MPREGIGEDDVRDEEDFLRGIREEGDDGRGFVLEALEGGVVLRVADLYRRGGVRGDLRGAVRWKEIHRAPSGLVG